MTCAPKGKAEVPDVPQRVVEGVVAPVAAVDVEDLDPVFLNELRDVERARRGGDAVGREPRSPRSRHGS